MRANFGREARTILLIYLTKSQLLLASDQLR
jgi:hypothetical protein